MAHVCAVFGVGGGFVIGGGLVFFVGFQYGAVAGWGFWLLCLWLVWVVGFI